MTTLAAECLVHSAIIEIARERFSSSLRFTWTDRKAKEYSHREANVIRRTPRRSTALQPTCEGGWSIPEGPGSTLGPFLASCNRHVVTTPQSLLPLVR